MILRQLTMQIITKVVVFFDFETGTGAGIIMMI
jgi:hypothetical protein